MDPHQAFAVANHTLALQFRAEVRPPTLGQWLIGHIGELDNAGIDVRSLHEDTARWTAQSAANRQQALQQCSARSTDLHRMLARPKPDLPHEAYGHLSIAVVPVDFLQNAFQHIQVGVINHEAPPSLAVADVHRCAQTLCKASLERRYFRRWPRWPSL